MSESTPRKRSRLACTLCQSRKRKCSGGQPCSTCAQTGAECQYNARKKRPRSHSLYQASLSLSERPTDGWSNAVPNTISAGANAAVQASPRRTSPEGVTNSLQANSGAAFVRKLGLKIDPAHAPRLQLFAWNIGERRISPTSSSALPSLPTTAPTPTTITKILSQEEMRRLAAIYFEKIDSCYTFLDRKTIFRRIAKRWESMSSPIDTAEQPHDAVLCGVAAFGHLFSRREIIAIETQLVEAARILLDKSILAAETPSVDVVTGWVLRAAYLRMTASPHAAWMASCTLMHLIEAAGLHLKTSDSEAAALLQTSPPETHDSQDGDMEYQGTSDPETRRRLFGMARHLNTWISFDLGRSRVVLHGATALSPTSIPQPRNPQHQAPPRVPRADLFHLLPLSEKLDPTGPSPQDLSELETALTSVLDIVYSEPSLILVQCNLMLCIYRRLRALNPHGPLSSNLLDRVLALACRGLRAARGMVALSCPWHQVANVPFQVVCSLLAIDNRAALALLADAMRTLREVLTAYDTTSMREAYSTAYLLIALHQRRKEDDTRALAEVLRVNAAAAAPADDQKDRYIAKTPLSDQSQRPEQAALDGLVSDAEFSWLGDLMIDMPSLQNFDLDQFLMTDVPWPLPEMGI
ncbi:C6 transcription factor, putative [Penicillium digitatum]|uniref:C6 transcription factor, putative n=3 Tax=Penicillium digitatum TaxID=36651 RepID=K9G192_PEND2|nr:C6 transcription factor, putative [Penicillium digitatum Pd1]EKV12873.1 C6 transcription factor, putative [Penicillium digitatum Pd1]EKV14647.1 C6 transcription factor, putative [Penicillium digitatum PHI26]QQK43382.1 C6 transcription factor, putative [Penicillium digitatum]